jgi:hypothetical protein
VSTRKAYVVICSMAATPKKFASFLFYSLDWSESVSSLIRLTVMVLTIKLIA